MTAELFPTGDAHISPCGRYRYDLTRQLGHSSRSRVLFVMLNPSTADARIDDPTIRKCIGFATRKFQASSIAVVNLYAYRATKPKDLWRAWSAEYDVYGPLNTGYIHAAALRSDHVVVAWGALNLWSMSASARMHCREIARVVAQASGHPLQCLGRTQDGQPRHPLMVAYDTPLEVWS